ncbi:substrate-binding domain-containing protein [Bacillus sp. AFS031507]|uniref:substrate-binding domain-containing protein n=1 Tax=Bacillus sp. AFS031507 TaxID=2033496 RepID=UPI000BFCA5D5|nr:substrate-binding domain-containing protein [Bacillus sp. AFS031507]PGY11936.1 sugar ABC transporter substrate-binding protein [Bacillus sp. AFS031507]
MRKKLLSLGMTVGLTLSLVACGSTATTEKSSGTSASKDAAATAPVKEIDLNPTTVLGVGPNGEKAVSPSELTLTDAEKQKLKDGNFKAAFVYHMQSNAPNQVKLAAAKTLLEELGVEVVSVTDANFNAQTEIANIESTMALKPDVMITMPVDPEATASAYKEVAKAGTKLVFMENTPKGFKPGKDYASLVNADSYGNGVAAADMLAQQIGYKGEVAMVYYDAVFFVTNERDRGFKDQIKKYPNIKLVAESPFADPNKVGEVADGLLVNQPNLKGVYASWDVIAEAVIASAKSAGKNDLVITTVDLGENTARMIAEDGMIRGTAAPRSYDQGIAEAMAAAYALLGKQGPTYICPPALPVMKENVVDAFQIAYHKDAPSVVEKALKKGK